MQRRKGEILELPLDRVDAEPVSQGCKHLERLAGLLGLLLLWQSVDRAHVVEAICELDQDHPDVACHCNHHLPVVLRLSLIAAAKGDLGQLGNPVHQLRNGGPELCLDLLDAGARVFDGVVQQRGSDRFRIEAQLRTYLRYFEGVRDELFA